MKFGLSDSIINSIILVLESNSKVDKAFIFGSRAKGNYRDASDIDIAIKGNDLNFDDVLQLGVKLDDLNLPYKIDLLNYNTIKEPDLKDHINRVGIELYSRWKEIKLGDVVEINQKTIDKNYKHSIIEYLDTGSITQNKIERFQKFNLVDAPSRAKRLVNKNDIIYSTVRPIQRHYGFIEDASANMVVSTGFAVISTIKEKANAKYLFYLLSSDDIVNYLDSIADGSTSAYPSLRPDDLAVLDILLPPLTEQTVIASILSSLDDKIGLLHRQNKTLEQLAETLFRQWFVEEAEESWEEKSLTDIADYLNGLALQKFPAKIDYLPVIKIREMKQGISENTDRCSRDIPTQYIIKDGDVLFSWIGSLEVVLWTGGEGALNQHLFKVSSKEYPKWFYYLATKHHLAEFKVIAESKSTTMGHIQREHLKQAMISIPSKELFEQYDERIAPMIDKLIDNHKQIRTLTQTRDTLLPKLMSGEVRVKMSEL
jgi:type I restriction enzyme S subunit